MSSFEFTYNGHHYKVVPVENSNEYSVIKDSRFTRRAGGDVIKFYYAKSGRLLLKTSCESEIAALFRKEARHE